MPPLRSRPDRTRPAPRWVKRVLLSLLLAVVIAAGVVFGFAFLVSRAGAQTDDAPVAALKGAYEGLGTAQGMRIVIDDAGRTPSGRFTDSNGIEAEIGGGWKAGGLEAVLAFPQRAVFVRLAPVSLGLQMTVLPIDGEGKPIPEQRRVLAFLREGVRMPKQPALYQDPPERADGESDPDVFLQSYQFWPPDGVARGFSQIGPRYRTMIRFFPQLHADVLWKLCDADTGRELLAESLRGQGVDCAAIVGTVERLQREGRFLDWKAAVQKEIDLMMPSVQCARGYIVKAEVCEPAARRVAQAAVSMETVAGALARWR